MNKNKWTEELKKAYDEMKEALKLFQDKLRYNDKYLGKELKPNEPIEAHNMDEMVKDYRREDELKLDYLKKSVLYYRLKAEEENRPSLNELAKLKELEAEELEYKLNHEK